MFQVSVVEEAFQSVLGQLRAKMELKTQLHQKRILLQNLEHISLTLNKIEKLLAVGSSGGGGGDDSAGGGGIIADGDVIERVAVDIHHLNYCMAKVPSDSAFYR